MSDKDEVIEKAKDEVVQAAKDWVVQFPSEMAADLNLRAAITRLCRLTGETLG